MNGGDLQLALREWRQDMTRPVTVAALMGSALVLMVSAPFDTDRLLRPLPRLLYWTLVVWATYGWGVAVDRALGARLGRHGIGWRILGCGFATGVGVMGIVLALNRLVFDWVPSRAELPDFAGALFVIAYVVTAVLNIAGRQHSRDAGAASAPPAMAPLLDRLPLDKRGDLMALSVEDHYVHVQTTRGTDMLLMRLGDAIREVGGTPGAQVHRSHWVAWAQVASARRVGDRAILTLRDGREIPVSRANVSRIREAGLLPR